MAKYLRNIINIFLFYFSCHKMVGTFKIITLAASLNENIVDLDKETFNDGGSIQVENARIKCWKAGGHGHQTYLQVVENSCNLGVNTGTLLNLQKPLKIV